MFLWVSEVSSLICAAGQAGAAEADIVPDHFYPCAVARSVFEGDIAIVIKKVHFCLNSYVNILKSWRFTVLMYDGA